MAKRPKPASVHPDVVASAELLAKQVWDGGGKPALLLMPQDLDPRHFVPILEHAIAQGWLRVQGERWCLVM